MTPTRLIQPRNVRVGDLMATTNGMREVLKVELLRHPRLPHHSTKLNPYRAINYRQNRVYRVDITVQDVMSDVGTVLTFLIDRPTKVKVQRPAGSIKPMACGGCGTCAKCIASQGRAEARAVD